MNECLVRKPKVGAIQSNYIPWRGYFDFIDDCDIFVFYDDVKYSHKSWRNRNKIKTPSGPIWLTVPVIHNASTLINSAKIKHDERWLEKHLKSIALNYGKSPYFADYYYSLEEIYKRRHDTISELNIDICRWVMSELKIKTKTYISSDFDISGSKYDRPLKIAKHLGASTFITGPTAISYLNANGFFSARIDVLVKLYDYLPYPQLYGEYVPDLSVLDLLFSCGPESREFLKSSTPNQPLKPNHLHNI